MQAVRLRQFGKITDLKIEELATPSPAAGELLLRLSAASVNPSDVKNVHGFMQQTTLPRTPGRDFAGTVIAGPPDSIGKEVWGTGGDLGFTRDGSHADHLIIPATAAVLRPPAISANSAACSGVTFVTAAYALREASLVPNQTIVVIGVFGGVGRAAAQIAKRAAARVIGIARTSPPADLPPSLVGVPFIDSSREDVSLFIRRLTDAHGADIVFDTVGGSMLLEALKMLAPCGRIIEISAGQNPNVTLNLRDFYHQQARLIGIDSLSLDAVQCAQILRDLSPGFASGELTPPPIAATYPLDHAIEGYEAVEAGRGEGRHVLVPNA